MLSRAWQTVFPKKCLENGAVSDEENDFVHLETRDVENFIVENGRVVGYTAVIDIDESQISPTQGPRPEKEHRPFDGDRDSIFDAARNTALLEVEIRKNDGTIQKGHGTAFFVTEKHLLTAGHNVCNSLGTVISIRIAYPGVKVYDESEKMATFDCILLKTLYSDDVQNGRLAKDVAILRCEAHNGGSYLPLSSDQLPLNAVVDILGYPAFGHDSCISRHSDLTNSKTSETSSKILLPPKTLMVTRGTVEKMDDGLISYKVSTCPGMSGGCLLFDGKVYGVHLGHPTCSLKENSAISFTDPEVQEMLKSNLIDVLTTSVGDFQMVDRREADSVST